jgi:hypothetical protein
MMHKRLFAAINLAVAMQTAVHGLNERRSIRSVFVGRDSLTDLVKLYADAG